MIRMGWLCCVLLGCGCSQKTGLPRALEKQLGVASLDQMTFTNLCSQALTAADPTSTVTIAGPLALAVTTRGAQVRVSFENEWNGEPDGRAEAVWKKAKELGTIVSKVVGDGAAPPAAAVVTSLDAGRFDSAIPQGRYRGRAENIVPLVRGEVDAAVLGIKSGKYSQIGEPLAGDIWVIYAFNEPEMFAPVTSMDLARLHIPRDQLESLALKNLRAAIPPVTKATKAGWTMLTLPNSGGNFEASLMLLEDIWAEEQQHVAGELVAIVPARDVLSFTSSKNPDLRGFLKKKAGSFAQFDHHVSTRAYVRRAGKWVVFSEPAEE